MDYVRFFLLTLCVVVCIAREVPPPGEISTASPASDSKVVSSLKIVEPARHDASSIKTYTKENVPKSRKVTHVDSYEDDKKSKGSLESSSSGETKKKVSSTTKAASAEKIATVKLHPVKVSEGVVLSVPVNNDSVANIATGENNKNAAPANPANTSNAINKKDKSNNENKTSGLENTSKSPTSVSNSPSKEKVSQELSSSMDTKLTKPKSTIATTTDKTSSMAVNAKKLPLTTSTSTTSSTSTTTTTTTTTTSTTPKPKKPKITLSVEDFPDLDKESLAIHNSTNHKYEMSSSTLSAKFPIPEAPYAQPSQEFSTSSFHGGRDYIVPIVSMIFIIPLAIGILITTYRRFRDCWSTRHYRRMDFLVDGMYND